MAVNQNATYPQTYRNPTGFQRWWNRNQLKVIPYFYIAPFFILFSIFLLYPIANSFYISFHKQYITGEPTFVGLKNYIGLFSDPRFKNSLFNTTVYALGSLFIQVPIAFLSAFSQRQEPLSHGLFYAAAHFNHCCQFDVWHFV